MKDKNILGKALVTIGLLALMITQVYQHYQLAKPSYLDFITPTSFEPLIKIIRAQQPADRAVLKPYMRYYQTVINMMPEQTDALLMLGVISYYVHDYNRAAESFKKAIKQNPQIILYHYNLGVVYLAQGQPRLAAASFTNGTKTDAAENLDWLSFSKIYTDVLWSAGIKREKVRELVPAFYNINRQALQGLLRGATVKVQVMLF